MVPPHRGFCGILVTWSGSGNHQSPVASGHDERVGVSRELGVTVAVAVSGDHDTTNEINLYSTMFIIYNPGSGSQL